MTSIMKTRSFLAVAALLYLPLVSLSAEDGPLVEVFATGVGLSQAAAMKAANKSAVEQVVGTLVDASTLSANDDVVEDKILTYSAGLIADSKIVGTPKKSADGLITVKVKATVKKTALKEKLVAAKLVSVEVDGESLWAQMVSAQENLADAEAMIKDVLSKHTACIVAETVPGKTGKSPLDLDPKSGEVFANVRVRIDPAKYGQFVQEVHQKLGKIADLTWTAAAKPDIGHEWTCRYVWSKDVFPSDSPCGLLVLENPRMLKGSLFWFDENKWSVVEKAIDTGSIAIEVSILDKSGSEIGGGALRCDRRGIDFSEKPVFSIFSLPFRDSWIPNMKTGVVAPWFGGSAQAGNMNDPKHFGFWLREGPVGPYRKNPPPSETVLRIPLGKFSTDELKTAGKLDVKVGHMKDGQFEE